MAKKSNIWIFFLLALIALYFLMKNNQSSFGAAATQSVQTLPNGINTVIVNIKTSTGTSIGDVTFPLSWDSITTFLNTSVFLQIDEYKNNTTKGGPELKYSLSNDGTNFTPNPIPIVVNVGSIKLFAPNADGNTQCISKNDSEKYGFTTQAELANAVCANTLGYSGSTTIGQQLDCINDTYKKYKCDPKTGNLNVVIPAYGTGYYYLIQSYGPSGIGTNLNTQPSASQCSTTIQNQSATVSLVSGILYIYIYTANNTTTPINIYYYKGGSYNGATLINSVKGPTNNGLYTTDSGIAYVPNITIPSATVTVTSAVSTITV